jgi:membrane peptidoglycan carboxypeptidase
VNSNQNIPALLLPRPAKPFFRRWRKQLLGLLILVILLGALLLAIEIKTSSLQAHYLTRHVAWLDYRMIEGASDSLHFPAQGPFDQRMGYTELPRLIERLGARGFTLRQQARFSSALMDFTGRGYFPPYREKTQAGLDLTDCRNETLYRFRYPYRGYTDFASVPPQIAQALMFIENRDLLDNTNPKINPAVDWVRFMRAVLGRLGRMVNDDFDAPGGSTLATQIEKYRHSPDGVTHNASDKLRQMMSASLRAYLEGEETLPVRRRILLDYLNTVPLSAAPGYGEVNGLGDGLWVWFGADLDTVNSLLAAPESNGDKLAAQGQALHQVVALMIAHRRPSFYLSRSGREELERLSQSYIRLLASNDLIGTALRDAALGAPLQFRDMKANPAFFPTDVGKGVSTIRNRLAGLLDTSLYELDRLDASVSTTLNGALQKQANDFLGQLTDAEFARNQGLLGERMLNPATLGAVRYSFTLVERTPNGNRVLAQTDTTDQPLDINEGSKLELGSTAKLRVLTTYLEIIAELHQRLAGQTVAELRGQPTVPNDRLTQWAIDYLATTTDRNLPAMLQAALERHYSASPGESFFTGGGLHTFNNFNRDDNSRSPTVREALQGSINLPFVRLMRDVVRYTMYQVPGSTAQMLKDNDDPRRQEYLARFADREGQVFLRRFWHKYQGKNPEEIRDTFLDGLRPSADRLSAVFRYLSPQATPEALGEFLSQRLDKDGLNAKRIASLYERNSPEAYDLPDRGYVARVHPLELWLVGFLSNKPEAGWTETVAASADERQAVYRWLFRTRFKGAQDSRIHTMLEVEAFLDIHGRWARLGYPFGHLVPSLATALGSSGDRPAALAELMGIIMNDGVRQPTMRIDRLNFATGTPYETRFVQEAGNGQRVMAVEVAAALRNALSEVVEGGTARRLSGAFKLADGSPLVLGGKTGTGDNRIVISHNGSRGVAMNRTATFVFYLGPRHFGTLTAYVVGPKADSHRFTSALPVQILKSMGPLILPYLEPQGTANCIAQ